jgi:endonuclease G
MIALLLAAALFAGDQPPVAKDAVTVTFDGFAVGYVKAWGEPAWSAQHETADSIAQAAKTTRSGSFYACTLPDGSKSVSPKVYAKSGYDLGHQTEAASQVVKPPTFGTCNMSPQKPNLNRKVWAGIEAAVRNLAVKDGEVYVVTGPVIPDGPQRLGGVVDVPSHSWKAVYDPKSGAAAYLCQNTDMPVCSEESVAALQIGFDPFPGLPADVKATAITPPQPTKGGHLQ